MIPAPIIVFSSIILLLKLDKDDIIMSAVLVKVQITGCEPSSNSNKIENVKFIYSTNKYNGVIVFNTILLQPNWLQRPGHLQLLSVGWQNVMKLLN